MADFSVQDIYLWVNFLANKYQSGQITDDNFNTALKFCAFELFRSESGMPESYQPDYPIPPISWQVTNTISDDLRPFIVKQAINKNASGYFPFPDNYAAFSSMYYNYKKNADECGGKPTSALKWIEPVTDDTLRVRLTSNIKPPSDVFPITAWYSYGFKVFPININKIELTYLKKPVVPVRGYTQLPNGQTQYDPATSVQTDFPDTLIPNFAVRIAKVYGINIREDQFIAYMNQRIERGQF